MSQKWDIKNADGLPDDYDRELSAFLSSFMDPGNDPIWSTQFLNWKLIDNVAGKGFVSLALSSGTIVGATTVTRKSFYYYGSTYQFGELGDGYTHSGFRRLGIFAALINELKPRVEQENVIVIYGLPNEQAKKIEEKYCNFITHKTFRIIQGFSCFNILRFLSEKMPLIFQKAIAILSRILNFMLRGLQNWWIFIGKLDGLSIQLAQEAPSDQNSLWEKCKKHYDILQIRDLPYIQFRFFKNPLAHYNFYTARKNGQLEGYLVTRIQKMNGRKKCVIADWLYEPSKPLTLLALINRALKNEYKNEIDMTATWINYTSFDKFIFLMSGFILKKSQPIIFQNNPMGLALLRGSQKWHFTIADSDNV